MQRSFVGGPAGGQDSAFSKMTMLSEARARTPARLHCLEWERRGELAGAADEGLDALVDHAELGSLVDSACGRGALRGGS